MNETMEQKLKNAKRWLGKHYVFHKANHVKRNGVEKKQYNLQLRKAA